MTLAKGQMGSINNTCLLIFTYRIHLTEPQCTLDYNDTVHDVIYSTFYKASQILKAGH